MDKNTGFLVETKTGKRGRTFHYEQLPNGKCIVHLENPDSDVKKMLCTFTTLKIIGYVN